MATHCLDRAESPAQSFWRPLAQRAGWEVTTAAQYLGISLRQLERLCQEQLGCTPRDYFQRERMIAASQLLATGQSVKIIALQVGYSRPANFSRDFKRHFGRPARAFAPRPQFVLPPPPPSKTF